MEDVVAADLRLAAPPASDQEFLRRVMLERHARYVPVMEGATLLVPIGIVLAGFTALPAVELARRVAAMRSNTGQDGVIVAKNTGNVFFSVR